MTTRLTILGCGSAVPTVQNKPSSQILEMCDKLFLIDCGEGTQNTIRELGVHTNRLYSIFISHLHGDHCFGLLGLLSTLGMLGRTQDMHIYAHKDLEQLLTPLLAYFCSHLPFSIIFHHINPRRSELIFDDRTLTVRTIPLRHTVPTCGFLFEEKPRRIHRETDAKPFSYAYCSDTGYKPAIRRWIDGVNVLYHEATYTEAQRDSAERYQHCTAAQAAKIATKVNAGTLIIGHFSARINDQSTFLNEAQTIFPNTILAEEHRTYEFNS
ncbi:MAG: ribonuclease Z [Paludibacteraceae bacterium]|nr:ribonuclease Z [Paludibacteraceae bacterium]